MSDTGGPQNLGEEPQGSSLGVQDGGMDAAQPAETNIAVKMEPDLPESTVVPSASFPFLKAAIDQSSSSELERLKAEGIKVCSGMEELLRCHPENEEIAHWLAEINSTGKQAHRTTFEISVVGNTGHGKSSLINALLNETRLVPTSFMKACTSVVTKISWNESDDPDQKYYGEVVFMTSDEWRSELDLLVEDLKASETQNPASLARDTKSSAGIAWAKLKAVYPFIKVEDVLELGSEKLASESNVRSVLDQVTSFSNKSCEPFYNELQKYVTSSPKVTATLCRDDNQSKNDRSDSFGNSTCEHGEAKGRAKRMALWPLIKVVKLFTKAEILSTGACFVDLPGYGDSNSARSVVAERYLERSDSIWIVSSIERAVDDKVAQDLLGRSFKQQLQYDGKLSKVTFICTKTDNMNIDEAVDSLESPELATIEERHSDAKSCLEEWEWENKSRLERNEKRANTLIKSALSQKVQVQRQQSLEAYTNHAVSDVSSTNPRKTKATSELSNQAKRQKEDTLFTDAALVNTANGQESATSNSADRANENSESIMSKELAEAHDLLSKVNLGKMEYEKLKTEFEEAKHQLYAFCLLERNTLSKATIRREFADGIRELDQDSADSGHTDNHEAVEETREGTRDYKALELSLPVFCVSSRVYQILDGRQGGSDDMTRGFTIGSTEIPDLISHAKNLALSERDQATRDFLSQLLQASNSVYLWTNKAPQLLEKSRRKALDCAFTRLVADLDSTVESLIEATREIISDRLVKRFDFAVNQAAKQAPGVADEWCRNAMPLTYKATCRRLGKFSSQSGEYNFNRDLAYILKQRLGKQWECTFQRDIPHIAENSYTQMVESICRFHEVVEQNMGDAGSLEELEQQLQSRLVSLGRISRITGRQVKRFNRASSRKIEPGIKTSMTGIYKDCAGESGRGMWIRVQNMMRANMLNHGAEHFTNATKGIKKELEDLCETLQDTYSTETQSIIEGMRRDYTMVSPHPGRVEDESKQAREDMKQLLQTIDEHFRPQVEVSEHTDSRAP